MDQKFHFYSHDFSKYTENTGKEFSSYSLHKVLNYFEAYLILVDQFGLSIEYGGEKTAFTIYFNYKGKPCGICLEKSGLHLYTQCEKSECDEIVKVLRKLKKEINRIYQDQAKKIIVSGNVTINNNSNFMFDRFLFLYDLFTKIDNKELFHDSNSIKSIKAMYIFISVIESWFAWLEHICIILLSVSGYNPNIDDILEFVASNWSVKYNRIFNPKGNNPYFSKKHNDLRRIKETIRNSYCHGGIRQNNSEILVHWKGIGAIPYILSDTDIYPDLFLQNFTYDFKKDLNTINSFNDEFMNGSYRLKYKLLHSGLDISFAEDNIIKLNKVINDEFELDSYLDYECGYQDAVVNFEL